MVQVAQRGGEVQAEPGDLLGVEPPVALDQVRDRLAVERLHDHAIGPSLEQLVAADDVRVR